MAVKSVNPRVQIISVESERAPGFYASMKGIYKKILRLLNIYIIEYLFQLVDLFLRNVNRH